MKFLICLGILIAAIIAALAYLPPETTAAIGGKTAAVAIRGSKGAKRFVSEFSKRWGESDEAKEVEDAVRDKLKDVVIP